MSINSLDVAASALHTSFVPFLPPPLIRFFRSCDSRLDVVNGSTLLLVLTLLLGFGLCRLLFGRKKMSNADQYQQSAAENMGLDIRRNENENSQNQVWIVGPTGAGKTALFHRLRSDVAVPTVSSMMADDATIRFDRRDDESSSGLEDLSWIKIVDYPGHPRLRTSLLPGLRLPSVMRTVLCVDASNLSRPSLSDAAAILYDILTDTAAHGIRGGHGGRKMEIIIACTHQDLHGSRSPARIKLALASELDRMASLVGDGRVRLPPLTAAAGAVGVVNWKRDLTLSVHFIGLALGGGKEDGLDEVRNFVLNGLSDQKEQTKMKRAGKS